MGWLLAVLVLALVAAILPAQRRAYVLQYLFFCRFAVTVGALLVVLPLLALGPGKSFLGNLLALDGAGVAVVGGFATLAALALMFTVDLLLAAVPSRFKLPFFRGDATETGLLGWLYRLARGASPRLARLRTAVFFLLFAVPLVVTAALRSGDARMLVPAAAGAAAAFLLRWIATVIARTYVRPRTEPPFRRLAERYQESVATGAGTPGHGRFLQGYVESAAIGLQHVRALGLLGLVGALYLSGYWLLRPGAFPAVAGVVPPLALVLLLLVILCWLFSGLAFFFDLYRVPLLLIATAGSFAMYQYSSSDHYYRTVPAAGAPSDASPGRLFEEWNRRHPANRFPVMIVVTASGGGIVAARWTAQVLTGLEHDSALGSRFGDALTFVSSVSGGGVGAMYFVARYADGNPPPQAELEGILRAAGTSSLEATAWGLLYPDLWRAVLPWLVRDLTLDRGWALEQSWSRQLARAATLRQWRQDVAAARRPAQTFNATVTETGERFLVTPLGGAAAPAVEGPRSFLELYPDRDLSVVTAARLSAAFPFVTPIGRPAAGSVPDSIAYHVADGGYYDNFGVMSAIEFLRAILPTYVRADPVSRVRRTRVVLLQIRLAPGERPAAATGSGWLYAAIGPAVTMLNVRQAAQRARNELELSLLREAWEKQGVAIESIEFELPAGGPTSWRLSAAELAAINAAWDASPARDSRARLKLLLEPVHAR